MPRGQEANILDAASQGASNAVFLVANIGGTLIAVLAFIAFINGLLGWTCHLIGYEGITFQYVIGKIFIPLSWLMGVDDQDLSQVGALVGIKSFVNEFAAYDELNKVGDLISARSKVFKNIFFKDSGIIFAVWHRIWSQDPSPDAKELDFSQIRDLKRG